MSRKRLTTVKTSKITVAGQTYRLVEFGLDAIHLAPLNSTKTLCGRTGGRPISTTAPTCKRCLASIDRQLPVATADPADIAAVTNWARQTLGTRLCTEIRDVPAELIPAVRAAIRSVLRELGRTGHTYVDQFGVISGAIWPRTKEENRRGEMELMKTMARAKDPTNQSPPERPWSTSWRDLTL